MNFCKSSVRFSASDGWLHSCVCHSLERREGPKSHDETPKKLKKGKVEIDYKLDLHGLTQIEAKQALEQAILGAWKNKLRLILVITGKGLRQSKSDGLNDNEATGILRRAVPKWLKETPLSNFVLAFSPAQQTHGGAGALYVLLRRQIDDRDRGLKGVQSRF